MIFLTSAEQAALNHMNDASARAGGLGNLLTGSVIVNASGQIAIRGLVTYETNPALGTNTAILGATALTASAQTGVVPTAQPDFPRVLLAKGNASGIAGNVVIHGTDYAGNTVSDTIALSGASAVSGLVAFKKVTGIDLPIQTHAGTDTVSIGTANLIGFPTAVPDAGAVLMHDFNGATDSGTTTADATVGKSVYAPAGTFDGTKKLDLTYIA